MKKKIILGVLICIAIYQVSSVYNWVVAERKKYRSKSITPNTPNTLNQEPPKKCINYPINTSPGSFYEGVADSTTLKIVSTVFQGLVLIGLLFMYFF